MIKVDLGDLNYIEDYRVYKNRNYEIVFTTAEKNRSFNRWTPDGVINLEGIKDDFKVNDVVFVKQTHSDTVHFYKGNVEGFKDLEGDAIITKDENVAIGVFTADCVPIIVIVEELDIVGVIHSGWRGTYNSIVLKTISRMKAEGNFSMDNVKIIIGPHIKQCCYEISEELKVKFIQKKSNLKNLFIDRNLSLEEFIIDDLIDIGVRGDNIIVVDNCTHCCNSTKLHSYRKVDGEYGRLFSFIIKR